MSNYTITTDFGAKDSLPSSNDSKVVRGSEFTTEFTNIQTAIATKADTAGDTFTGVVNFSNDIAVNTNTLFVDVSTAKVGIGNTSPAYPLDVTGSAQLSGGDLILRSDSDSADTQYIRFENYPTDIRTAYIRADYTSQTAGGGTSLAFGANDHATATDTDSMVIDIEGNVGIGTDSPDQELHVSASATPVIRIESTKAGLGVNESIGSLEFEKTDASGGGAGVASSINCFTTDLGGEVALGFYTGGSSGNNVERMRIDASGKVGIGTTSPASRLAIHGAADVAHIVQTNPTNSQKLEIGNAYSLYTGASGAVSAIASDSTLAFATSDTERMRIDSSGNLLVGTTDTSIYDNTSGGNTGFVYSPNHLLQAARETTTPTQSVMNLNKMGVDGHIIECYKDGSNVGNIGTVGGDMYLATGARGIHISDGANSIVPCNATGGDSDATTSLGLAGARFQDLYLSGGVYLGGTTSANKLDDYEEGTWTPSYTITNATVTHDLQQGKYTKIGNVVYIQMLIGTDAVTGSFSGSNVLITGLPFAASTTLSGSVGHHYAFASELDSPKWLIANGTTTFTIYDSDNISSNTKGVKLLTGVNGNRMYITGTYHTDS